MGAEMGETMSKHEHKEHEHTVAYCRVCDVAYCETCSQQWVNALKQWPITWNGVNAAWNRYPTIFKGNTGGPQLLAGGHDAHGTSTV